MADHDELSTSSHDLPISEALAAHMRTGWADTDRTGLGPAEVAQYAARRRAALSALFPGETLVVPTGTQLARSNDTQFDFRPGTDFVWLTGGHTPDAVLVLTPAETTGPEAAAGAGAAGPGGHTATLYARERSSRSTDAFFRDRAHGELWVGRRPSLAETEVTLGIPTAPLDELVKVLAGLDPATARVRRGIDLRVDAAVPTGDDDDRHHAGGRGAGARDAGLAASLAELRLVKDDWEVAQLRAAVDATVRGFADVVRALPADRDSSERLVDGVFGLRARHDGNTVGYSTIAAAGSHAGTLHWTSNDGRVRPGELLLLDAGVEGRHLYTADVTRTLPVSGRFSPVQRRVYDLVLAAQEAGIAAVRPGARWREIHAACMRVVAHGLADWGLLTVGAEESLDPACGLHRRWTLHSSGHMLGLDVHDCAKARAETYLDGTLEAGHVLTVEPGLYFQADDLTVPAEYRGIGVRIEDDVLVTRHGSEVLSGALPKAADEVEAWMAEERAAGPRLPG